MELRDRLAASIQDQQAQVIVGDAIERRYLTHDLVRFLINAAIQRAVDDGATAPQNLDFLMYGYYGEQEQSCEETDGGATSAQVIRLDDEQLKLKRQVALSYRDPGLAAEREDLLARNGLEWFAIETLQPADKAGRRAEQDTTVPFYEIHGKQLAAQGIYPDAIEYERDVVPIRRALESRG